MSEAIDDMMQWWSLFTSMVKTGTPKYAVASHRVAQSIAFDARVRSDWPHDFPSTEVSLAVDAWVKSCDTPDLLALCITKSLDIAAASEGEPFVLPHYLACALVHGMRSHQRMSDTYWRAASHEYQQRGKARDAEWRERQAKMIADGEQRMLQDLEDKVFGRKPIDG